MLNFNRKDIDWDTINQSISAINWRGLGERKDVTTYMEFLENTAMKLCRAHVRKRTKCRPKTVRYLCTLYSRRSFISTRLGSGKLHLKHKMKIEEEINTIERKLNLYYSNQVEEA